MATSLLIFALGFGLVFWLMRAMERFVPWFMLKVSHWRSRYSAKRAHRFQKAQERALLPLVHRPLANPERIAICSALVSSGLNVVANWGAAIGIARTPGVEAATDDEIVEILKRCTPDVHWVASGATQSMRYFSSYGESSALI